MLSRLLTTALLTTIATTSTAQSPLITPGFPYYVGAAHAIYFDLTLHTDVTFTMFEINVRIPGVTGTVEVYARPGTCVGFEQSSAGWTLVGSANTVSNGQEVPTPVDFAASATGSITMTAGSYGMAVGVTGMGAQCSPAFNSTNQIASNHEISLTGRSSCWQLFSNCNSLNTNHAPGIALHYTVPSSWAAASPFGASCVEQTSTFYERFWGGSGPVFDLAAQPGNVKVLQLMWTGSGYAVMPPAESALVPGSNWVTPVTPDLAMADDEVRPLALGFGLPWEGDPSGHATTHVRLSSNGFLTLTNNCTNTTWLCSTAWGGLQSLLGRNGAIGIGPDAKLLFFASDLDPSRAGTVHFETNATNPAVPAGEAYVTFVGVADAMCSNCSPGAPVTVQVMLDSIGNVEYRYQQAANANHITWVGYTPGASIDPNGARYTRPIDLSAMSGPLITSSDLYGLALVADARPVLGTTFNLQLENVPIGSTFGLAAFSLATQPPLALGSIGMETCFLHIGSGLGVGTFTYGFGPTSFPVTLPPDPGLAGVAISFQGVSNSGTTSSGLISSNALRVFGQVR